MSQAISANPSAHPELPFYRNCLAALLRPSIITYKMLGEQRVNSWQAYRLMFVGSLIGSIIVSLGPFGSQLMAQRAFDALLLAMIPVAALISVVGLAAFAWCAHIFVRFFKGSESYAALTYALAAISAPLLIVTSIVDQIPGARVVLPILYLYWLVQYVLAIRAVSGISWAKAIVAMFLALLLLGLAWLGVAVLVGYSGILLP
jgi:hypothetical protein